MLTVMTRWAVLAATVLVFTACADDADPSPERQADLLHDEIGFLEVSVELTGRFPRQLDGWWAPGDGATVLVDEAGDEVMRTDGHLLTVPSFVPDVTSPLTTFDLDEPRWRFDQR